MDNLNAAGKVKMPASIITAISAACFYIAVILLVVYLNYRASGKIQSFLPAAIWAAIVVGVAQRDRLSWHAGVLFAIVAFLGNMIIAARTFSADRSVSEILLMFVISMLPLITVFFSLLARQSKEFISLICPNCGSDSIKANDFRFKKAKCKKCGNIW